MIVQDSGLVIKDLKDFPGPYTKYVSQTIGCSGILKLLEGKIDRSCGFTACLVFIDEAEQVHVFNEHNKAKYWGEIARPEETNYLFDECKDRKLWIWKSLLLWILKLLLNNENHQLQLIETYNLIYNKI